MRTLPALALAACVMASDVGHARADGPSHARVDGIERVYVDGPGEVHALVRDGDGRRWRRFATEGSPVTLALDQPPGVAWADLTPTPRTFAPPFPMERDSRPFAAVTVHVHDADQVGPGRRSLYHGVPVGPAPR